MWHVSNAIFLYDIEDSFTTIQGERVTKKCKNVLFPNHPQKQHRQACGQELLKQVKNCKKKYLVPFKTYCYKPIQTSLGQLFSRKDYFNLCESWKLRKTFPGIMYDVFEVLKKFSDPEKMDFLNHSGRIGLMLNVDWFQPYKHIQTNSIGAIYAVIMNLPRRLRFKKENLLLIGLIPNTAKEPPIHTFWHLLLKNF